MKHKSKLLAFLIASALIILLYFTLDLNRFDKQLLMASFNQTQTAASNQLTVIEVDEKTIQFFNQYPLPRNLYADLLEKLKPSPPSSIGFAIALNAPRFTPFNVPASAPTNDRLANIVKNSDFPIFIPTKLTKMPIEKSGAVYNYPTSSTIGQPTLGILLANKTVGTQSIPINFSININTIKYISFKDIIDGNFDKADIQNKKILITSSSIGLNDMYILPKYGRVAGSFIHILGYESLISAQQFSTIPNIIALILAILLIASLTFIQSNKSPLRAIYIGVATLISVTIATIILHHFFALILAPSLLYIAITASIALQIIQNIRNNTRILFLAKISSESALSNLKNNDLLTKLPNNNSFNKNLTTLYNTDNKERIILLISLNSLKEINEIHGREAGDIAILQLANILKTHLKGKAIISRYSNKIFSAIYNKANHNDYENLIKSLYEQISVPLILEDSEVAIDISIGGVIAPLHGKTPEALISNAIQALDYARETKSLNHFIYEENIAQKLRTKRQICAELNRAIKNEEFILYYQPQYEIRTNTLIGYEALVRWQDPVKGIRYPDEFIPIAEEFNLITQIGELVLKMGCNDAMQLPEHLSVALNISPMQFRNADIEFLCKKYLKQSGLAAHRLELEITESQMMDNIEHVKATLKKLKELGIKIAMDDFGTGYSSLQFLTELPFDKIKIDRSFTMKIGKSKQADALITTIIALGHSLDKQVVAEGVEDEDMIILLNAAGCHIGQGYHYGRPAALSETLTRLNQGPTRRRANH